jgi:molybdopterin-biosynthesis enzyme MoeA-like protein
MKIGLIIIGDEILSGKRQDKHLAKVIELLNARGMALAWARYLGDDPAGITAALAQGFASGDLVFSCGGIGATPDDHTRQCAAAALGRPLVLHPQAAELIRERMRDVAREQGLPYAPDRADNQHRLNMGVFPQGAQIIPNPYNKIAGFSVDHVHFVPGFPVMAWPMIEWVLDEQYPSLRGSGIQEERSVIVKGSMEATLTPLMEAVEAEFAGIKVFSLPCVDDAHVHGRHIDLGVKGRGPALEAAFQRLRAGLDGLAVPYLPETVRSA